MSCLAFLLVLRQSNKISDAIFLVMACKSFLQLFPALISRKLVYSVKLLLDPRLLSAFLCFCFQYLSLGLLVRYIK